MRTPIPPKQPRIPRRHYLCHRKLKRRMCPPRRARKCPPLRPSCPANLPHRSFNELPWRRHHRARFPDLAHLARDQVGLHKLDRNTLRRQL